MNELNVVLSNGSTITIGGVDDVEAFNSDILEVLNDHRTFLINFGGKIVSKSLIWAIVPKYEAEDSLNVQLSVGISFKVDPSKFDATKVANDVNQERTHFIYVAGAIVPKVIIEHIMN